MNFGQAVKAMAQGKKVRVVGSTELYEIVDGIIVTEAEGVDADVTELVDATFEEVGLGADQLYAVFNTEKNRWVSTTEPEKHRASGKRVAVFSLNQVV